MKFGTDGVRGPAGARPIDTEGALRVGAAAAMWAGPGATVVVARDTRPSGAELAAAVMAGVDGAGAVAVDAGVLPSPGLAAVLEATPGATGVMVTASHNPASDNGFKVLGPGGHKPTPSQTAQLEGWLSTAATVGRRPPHDATGPSREAYATAFVAALVHADALRGRRIAVDLAHGAAITSRAWLMARLPEVDWVWCGAGDGVINDYIGSQHPEVLSELVRVERCDAGIAVDGDADRCVLVDESGAVVPGDALAGLLAAGLGVSTLAVTIMSSHVLEAALPGVAVLRTPVGDKHLAAAIRTQGAQLGCEESGHVLFADGLPGGDGLFTGLTALSLTWRDGRTVSDAARPFQPWPRRLTGVTVASRPPLDEVTSVRMAIKEAEAQLGEGRTLLRYSGTEPLLRVFVEGPDDAVVARVSHVLTQACAAALG